MRNCCDLKLCITDAKSRSWYRDGANEDFNIEGFAADVAVEDAVGAVEDDALVEAGPADFLPILHVYAQHTDSGAHHEHCAGLLSSLVLADFA